MTTMQPKAAFGKICGGTAALQTHTACFQKPQPVSMLTTRQPISHSVGRLQLQQLSTSRSKVLDRLKLQCG